MSKRMIESEDIYKILPEINEASASEKKGGGRPPFWEMVFWWTRKPLISARSVIAASLLPEGINTQEFLENMKLKNVKKKPHNYNPIIPSHWGKYFEDKNMLDPFAGFGSIPLEGARLGLDVTASELLPTAVVFLKAVLEYPSKFGSNLVKDVEKWGEWITGQLKNDPELKELYDDDVAVYIGTWEVKCPHCGHWTPLIGNYWLARVKDGNKYKRVALMVPKKKGDEVKIEVVDINKMVKKGKIKIDKADNLKDYLNIKDNKITVEKDGKVIFWTQVPDSNISPRKSTAQCLYCSTPINFWDERNGLHYSTLDDLRDDMVPVGSVPYDELDFKIPNEKEIPVPGELKEILMGMGIELSESATLSKKKKGKEWLVQDEENVLLLQLSKRKGLEVYRTSSAEWYVKFALKKYHEGDERFARQRLLVKVKIVDGDLVFEPATEEDNEKLRRAKEKVQKLLAEGDPDVPTENLAPYGLFDIGASLKPLGYGISKWNQMFNPRQLLTLIKIVRLIREVGKQVEEEKKREGWSDEKAREYAEAVATYLSMAMSKFTDYNSISTSTHVSNPRGVDVGSTLSTRGITMKWNFCEENPIVPEAKISGVFVNSGGLSKMFDGVIRGVKYLTSAVYPDMQRTLIQSNKSHSVAVFQSDVTSLNLGERFDLVVTDPPYAYDVAYTELSDFYYVWLKRALSDKEGGKLVPRFHRDLFFRKFGNTWREIKTQWQEFAKKEVSTNPGRFMDEKEKKRRAEEHFRALLTQSFISMKEHLKEDGLIVTYYAHTSPEAWAALLDAGWKGAKMQVTNAFPIVTESAQRVTGRGKLTLDTSIVVVWRRGSEGEKNIIDIEDDITFASTKRTMHLLKYVMDYHYPLKGRDILVGAMAASLSVLTKYSKIVDPRGKSDTFSILRDYVYPSTVKGMLSGLLETFKIPKIHNSYAQYYLVLKAFFGSTSNGKKFSRFKPSSDDLRILGIALGMDATSLIGNNLVRKLEKKNEYEVLEPTDTTPFAMEEFLESERRLYPDDPDMRNPVDALHLLEYYAISLSKSKFEEMYERLKSLNSDYVDEAVNIASIFVKILKDYDPEKKMSKELLSKLKGEVLEVE